MIDRLFEAIGAFVQLSERPTSPSELVFTATRPIRTAWADVQQLRGRGHDDYDGWEAALCGLAGKARDLRNGRNRSGSVPRRTCPGTRSSRRATSSSTPWPPSARCADADLAAQVHEALAGATANYEARKQRAGAVDFLDLLIRARDLVRDDRAGARRVPAAVPLPAGRRVPGHRSAAGGAAAATRRRRVAERGDHRSVRHPGAAGRALHRRRPEAVDLPVPPRRRRRLSPHLRGAHRRRGPPGAAAHVLPQRPGNPARRQRRVQPAHDRRCRRSLQAEYVELQPSRDDSVSQPAVVALPVPRPLSERGNVTLAALAASLPEAVGEFVRWLVEDSGYTVPDEYGGDRGPGTADRGERVPQNSAATEPANAPPPRGRSAPATSACCSAASSTSRPT